MLRFQRGNVGLPCELFHYVFWHGEVNKFLSIVPFKVDTAVEVACSVLNNFICLFLEGIIEVLCVVLSNVFDPGVIESKVEPDGARFMLL